MGNRLCVPLRSTSRGKPCKTRTVSAAGRYGRRPVGTEWDSLRICRLPKSRSPGEETELCP